MAARPDRPPFFSTRAFPLAGDGYEADRFEKLVAIGDWPEALENLRVCLQAGSWRGNCGECVKCVLLGLYAQAAFGRVLPCLGREMTAEDVRKTSRCGDPNVYLRYHQLWKHARARGAAVPWLDDVEEALREAGIPLRPDIVPRPPPS